MLRKEVIFANRDLSASRTMAHRVNIFGSALDPQTKVHSDSLAHIRFRQIVDLCFDACFLHKATCLSITFFPCSRNEIAAQWIVLHASMSNQPAKRLAVQYFRLGT